MRISAILQDLGAFVFVPAVICVPAVLVCALAGEWRIMPGFVIAAGVSAGVGLYLRRRKSAGQQTRSLSSSMITVGGSWLAIGHIAAIPFLFWGWVDGDTSIAAAPFGSFWTSLFESMSGITSTGLTMASDASLLPRAIQIWRTLLEWVGGIGVVVLALAVIRPAEASDQLFVAEARQEHSAPTFRATAKRIWWVYGTLTTISVVLMATTGMPLWEALNHGMTGIATGGFTVTPDSFAGYGNAPRLAAMFIMLLGAVSFHTYGQIAAERDWKAPLSDVPLLVLLGAVATGGGALLAVEHARGAFGGTMPVMFQWVSALGTCGFQTDNLSAWGGAAVLLLTIAMFVGGTAGSTTGGLKIDRAILIVLGPLWHIRQRLSTHKGVQYYTIDGEKVKEADALRRYRGAVVLASLFVTTILAATLMLMTTLGASYPPHLIVFEVTSAMSNVGLSTGLTDASLPWLAKATLVVVMWMGRLEITSALVLIGLPLILAAKPHSGDSK